MDSNILKEISQIAEELKNTNETDLDSLKVCILFPLIEQLGYDTTTVGDVQTAPLYTPDASYKLDYGLRGINPEDFKTVIKVIKVGDNPKDEFSKIKSCIVQNKSIEYVIVTDCFRYFIYANDYNHNDLVDVCQFEINDFDSVIKEAFELLNNPVMEHNKQEYAEYDEPEEYEGPRSMQPLDESEEKPEKEKKTSKIKWPFVIIAQLLVIALVIVLVLVLRNPNSQILNIFNNGGPSELDYYSIASTLDLSINKNTQALSLNFYSKDIPQGGIVRFDIINGEDSSTVYGEVGNNGKLNGEYSIPNNWKDPLITVTAFLNFDEQNHIQPQNVRDKFGEVGEKMVGQDGAPSKFALIFEKLDYDSEAVREYLDWLNEQKEANAKAERLADFESYELRYDSLGNIKVIPKGYDMNNINITGNVHVYPQIFYDAKTNFAHLYLIAGQISSVTWSMFRSVSFYADGTAWTYEIGNNEKKQQVNGQYITEWIYFDNYNISSLPGETALLGTSSVSQVSFNGSKVATFTLSDAEKANISGMLALFNKYFSDMENPPSTSWFEDESVSENTNKDENNYSLGYIYTPDSILERDGFDQKKLNKLEDKLVAAKQNNTATDSQISSFDIASHKYRKISDEFKDSLMNYLKETPSMLVYGKDYESEDMVYYKIFFNYEKPRSIEDGYVPYLYVMENKTMYIPVKTDTGGTISDKSYASCVLSQKLYDMLMDEIDLADYEQIP